jgi:two-component system, chemotaxis family, protein-glutamate methylesterase/glutaminase
MADHDIIAIGTSAGGVEALIQLVRSLPADLPAAVFVVLHVAPEGPSMLPEILGRNTSLPVRHAVDGERVSMSRIYVAPPNNHLLVVKGQLRVIHGPKENLHRPAIDPLFRSVALEYGPRTVGVILTGARDDGTAGMSAIKGRGGLTVIQDPKEASYPSMPFNVQRQVQTDYSLPLREIGPLLVRLAKQPTKNGEYPVARQTRLRESNLAAGDRER